MIPVFEGTNSEEDTKIALIKAGFREEDITIHVFNTQTSTSYEESCERFVQLLEESHMLVLPG
ncbi:MAG: phosphoribosylformylglycinamidine synthase subunit PurQ [Anaerolineae bacterium]|nr:phosphoribosylformylglycinamidine synthase subunit PurQ [Anaerolineae bacterium]